MRSVPEMAANLASEMQAFLESMPQQIHLMRWSLLESCCRVLAFSSLVSTCIHKPRSQFIQRNYEIMRYESWEHHVCIRMNHGVTQSVWDPAGCALQCGKFSLSSLIRSSSLLYLSFLSYKPLHSYPLTASLDAWWQLVGGHIRFPAHIPVWRYATTPPIHPHPNALQPQITTKKKHPSLPSFILPHHWEWYRIKSSFESIYQGVNWRAITCNRFTSRPGMTCNIWM